MAVKLEYEYPRKIVIGTRGSPFALVQAGDVKNKIDNIGQDIEVELKIITTSGDWRPGDGEVRLDAAQGGKAQFTKEIQDALLSGDIDMAVHSMKDVETHLPQGLCVPFILPREDVRDVFISDTLQGVDELRDGHVVGTTSTRRESFIRRHYDGVDVVPLRGNVQTRIDKMKAGQVDATFLACAGLNRLGLAYDVQRAVSVGRLVSAAGQGAVGIEIRACDMKKMSFIDQIACFETALCVLCERSALAALGGGCHTPVGIYAAFDSDGMDDLRVRACLYSPCGGDVWEEDITQKVATKKDAETLGKAVGASLRSRVPEVVLSGILAV